MFQKAIEAVIQDGLRDIEQMVQCVEARVVYAKEEAEKRRGEIQALVDLAKDVPSAVFSRHSNVMIGTIHLPQAGSAYAEFRVNGNGTTLSGLMGPEGVKDGKYRVIVLLEPLS